jgi:hypothetical protein
MGQVAESNNAIISAGKKRRGERRREFEEAMIVDQWNGRLEERMTACAVSEIN